MLRSTGFLQGWCFSVAHAQACRWDELGALAPIRQFLGSLVENALRLFGPAGPPRNLHLSNEAARLLSQIHDFFEEQKLSPQHRVTVIDYVSKHSQWVGSFLAVDHVERESLRYLQFTICARPRVQHRVLDPRGDAGDAPSECVCEMPVALKVCKRKGKGPQSNVGRTYWCCSEAGSWDFFFGLCLYWGVCVCVWSVQSGSFALLFSVAFSGPNFHKCSCQLALAVPCLRFRGGLRFLSVV